MTLLASSSTEYRRAQARAKAKARRQREKHPEKNYRFDPYEYIVNKLGWTPWAGTAHQPGQVEVIEAYRLALRQLHEKDDFEQSRVEEADLQYWHPGDIIQNRIRIEAGHTVGKTKLASGIFSHFFDNFEPAIIYTYAPTYEQINDLLWKEIRSDRREKALPGRVLEKPELKYKPNWFAKGKATNNANNAGTERAQGQHGKYLMFILDEAEGMPDFVWNAIDSMTGGGIAIVLMLANPRTRLSQFHRERSSSFVKSFRISCLWHPNVTAGREVVPGAVRREYVDLMLDKHASVVTKHSDDSLTFEVPWRPGVIYKPDNEFMFRVLGVAPRESADNTFIPIGRYEAAVKREPLDEPINFASLGLDAARYGGDLGNVYVRHAGRLFRYAQIAKSDSWVYYDNAKKAAVYLAGQGVEHISIRIDGSGGYGSGAIDLLKKDEDLRLMFLTFTVYEVNFGASPSDPKSYADIATEMYAHLGESLKGLRVWDPPNELEGDLCERIYHTVNKSGPNVKKLEEKEKFKKRMYRSPDDGDGAALAGAPEFIFEGLVKRAATIRPSVTLTTDLPFA